MVIGLNIGVLGLFSLESVTMAELFGSRTRFTQLALAKEIGGILATAIGPVVAATLTAVTGSWWPIAAMLVVYSLITLVSACARARDPRPRPGPAGGRGMKAVVVHGADDLRIDERPDPVPGPGEVLDRDGVGRDLRVGPGVLAPRRLRDRGAEAAAGAGARGRRPDRRGRPRRHRPRSGSRSRSTRRSWSATGACPSGSPAGPTSTRGSATSARRRSTRTPTAGSASCGSCAPTRSARCPRA